MRDRLDDHIHVDDYVAGKGLTVSYWRLLYNFELAIECHLTFFISRELTSRGKEQTNRDLRSELGYRLSVQVDIHDPARPLAVVHVPSLGNKVGAYLRVKK